MLKKINEGGVESTEGFSVQIIGPEIIEYTYENHSVKLEINYDSIKRKAIIYASDATHWDTENTDISMTMNEKNLMIKHIKNAVQLLTGDFEVV